MMPYKLKKVNGGCQVQSVDTGKTHSNKPIPCDRAKAQMRALYAAMKSERSKGKEG